MVLSCSLITMAFNRKEQETKKGESCSVKKYGIQKGNIHWIIRKVLTGCSAHKKLDLVDAFKMEKKLVQFKQKDFEKEVNEDQLLAFQLARTQKQSIILPVKQLFCGLTKNVEDNKKKLYFSQLFQTGTSYVSMEMSSLGVGAKCKVPRSGLKVPEDAIVLKLNWCGQERAWLGDHMETPSLACKEGGI